MSQKQKIHNFLVRSKNPDADKALLLALKRAEEPYATALLETILDRKKSDSGLELIKNYPNYPDPWKDILTDRIENLHSSLQLAADSRQAQDRFTALSMIKQAGYGRLLDLVVRLLRDKNPRVATCAAESLAALGRDYSSRMFYRATEFITTSLPQRDHPDERDRWIFLTALDSALRNFLLHRSPQAVYAAMCTIPATNKQFWQNRLESFHPIGKIVRHHLIHSNDPETTNFFLSAFGCDELRIPASQALSNRLHIGFITDLIRNFTQCPDKNIRRGLGLVRQARWLDPKVFPPQNMDEPTQLAAINFVMALGAPVETKGNYLAAISTNGYETAALEAVKTLSRFPENTAAKMLRKSVNSIHETVAVSALSYLCHLEKQNLEPFLARQLNSSHPRARALARSYLKDYLLKQCQQNFDKLNIQGQSAAGRALLKIDPSFQQRWRKLSADTDPAQRLRAIKMTRQLNWVNVTLTRLLEMTNDIDKAVASCAIAALGQAGTPASRFVQNQLIDALRAGEIALAAELVGERSDDRSCLGGLLRGEIDGGVRHYGDHLCLSRGRNRQSIVTDW